MVDKPGPNETTYMYGYDVQGSVSQLVDRAGQVKASYGYTPYGASDGSLTSQDTSKNPYGYTAKRFDVTSGTLDMGARRFGPDIAHFLQQDFYADALSDIGLSNDPLTQNRYDLAGGNPVSFVEVDGHKPKLIKLCNINPADFFKNHKINCTRPPLRPLTNESGQSSMFAKGINSIFVPGARGFGIVSSSSGEDKQGGKIRLGQLLARLGEDAKDLSGDTNIFDAIKGGSTRERTEQIVARLRVRLKQAIKQFEKEGFTRSQEKALDEEPYLEAPFRGERIHTFMDRLVRRDRVLSKMLELPRTGRLRPDYVDSVTGIQFDVTTEQQFIVHANRYGSDLIVLAYVAL